ncbi:hypothetical protein EGR_10131 [Echinococcus granulosus]|uniref:Uncharacterized protein n=1 Tax=Echinococcus granulosus TaxID=6210 RepID=W6U1U2_ECHGR|nr:hypothetical protein EGR_10131 [Echinococcus granulosus]EUB55013.1 hypothetical protein EGR_10131 [Echinococcus granulosus]
MEIFASSPAICQANSISDRYRGTFYNQLVGRQFDRRQTLFIQIPRVINQSDITFHAAQVNEEEAMNIEVTFFKLAYMSSNIVCLFVMDLACTGKEHNVNPYLLAHTNENAARYFKSKNLVVKLATGKARNCGVIAIVSSISELEADLGERNFDRDDMLLGSCYPTYRTYAACPLPSFSSSNAFVPARYALSSLPPTFLQLLFHFLPIYFKFHYLSICCVPIYSLTLPLLPIFIHLATHTHLLFISLSSHPRPLLYYSFLHRFCDFFSAPDKIASTVKTHTRTQYKHNSGGCD